MPQRVAFAYFGEDCEKQSVSNVLPYGVVCTCSFGPWNVRCGLILLIYWPRNANGTNSGAPERRYGAFRLTLTTAYLPLQVYWPGVYVCPSVCVFG